MKQFLLIACSVYLIPVFSLFGADRFWISGSTANWNSTSNWSTTSGGSGGASVPGASDQVYFDANGIGDCLINTNVNVLGLNISSGYTGEIRQQLGNSVTVGSGNWAQFGGTFTAQTTTITVNGDLTLDNATITHGDNATIELYTLDLVVNGNLSLLNGGSIDVTGKGYDPQYGPGSTGVTNDSGSYGGLMGYAESGEENLVYGSFLAPINIGSGGGFFSSSGGGAIKLTISANLQVCSSCSLVADANNGMGSNGTGSGGSVYITAGTINHTGTISANGGQAVTRSNGGGGRVAILLTSPAADFTNATGSIVAYGGIGGVIGAAGTVYLEETADGVGLGDLIIDNNNRSTNEMVVTPIVAGDTWVVYNLIIQNRGKFSFPSGTTLDLRNAIVSSDINNVIRWEGTLLFSGGTFSVDQFTLIPVGSKTINSNLEVTNGGIIRHTDNSTAETYKLDLTVNGDLTLSGGGIIDVDGLGYDKDYGPGAPSDGTSDGGGHGGIGGDYQQDGVTSSTYGSIKNPVTIGSGGDSFSGGGAIKLTVSGQLTVNSGTTISADGAGAFGGGGAGGSIWITSGTIVTDGNLSANGAGPLNASSGGGGGRVAIILTGSGADFSNVNGDITAYGGDNNFADRDGAAGTVYLEEEMDVAGEGTLIIDNDDLDTYEQNVFTSLNEDVEVGSLQLRNNGIASLSGNTLTILNEVPGAISNETGSYIISESTDGASRLSWQIDETVGTYFFPFQTINGTNLNFTFDVTSAGTNNGSAGLVTVSTYPTADDNMPYPSGVTNMDDEDDIDKSDYVIDRFWNIDLTNFSTNPTVTMTFTYDEADLIGNSFTEEVMIPQRFDVAEDRWMPAGAGVINTTANTLTLSGVNQFSSWTFNDINNPLPVELLSFEAKLVHPNIELSWTTVAETGNDYFSVERSDNGINFVEIVRVQGAGTTNTSQSYSIYDQDAVRGMNYYRLKQTDFDGQFEYFETVAIFKEEELRPLFEVFPNPMDNGVFNVRMKGNSEETLILELFDTFGTLVHTENIVESDGLMTRRIGEIPKLTPGVYFLKARDSHQYNRQKILVR